MAEEVTLTRGQINDLIAGFATKNPDYRRALLAKPREVLAAQMGQEIPESVQVKVIEEKPNEFYIIIPYVPKEGEELSDEDLEKVAGGKGDSTDYRCTTYGGVGTHVEIDTGMF